MEARLQMFWTRIADVALTLLDRLLNSPPKPAKPLPPKVPAKHPPKLPPRKRVKL